MPVKVMETGDSWLHLHPMAFGLVGCQPLHSHQASAHQAVCLTGAATDPSVPTCHCTFYCVPTKCISSLLQYLQLSRPSLPTSHQVCSTFPLWRVNAATLNQIAGVHSYRFCNGKANHKYKNPLPEILKLYEEHISSWMYVSPLPTFNNYFVSCELKQLDHNFQIEQRHTQIFQDFPSSLQDSLTKHRK